MLYAIKNHKDYSRTFISQNIDSIFMRLSQYFLTFDLIHKLLMIFIFSSKILNFL